MTWYFKHVTTSIIYTLNIHFLNEHDFSKSGALSLKSSGFIPPEIPAILSFEWNLKTPMIPYF